MVKKSKEAPEAPSAAAEAVTGSDEAAEPVGTATPEDLPPGPAPLDTLCIEVCGELNQMSTGQDAHALRARAEGLLLQVVDGIGLPGGAVVECYRAAKERVGF